MFVGGSFLFPCDEETCVGGELEPPSCPFTSGRSVSTVTTTGSGSMAKRDCIKWRSSGTNCCENSSDAACLADCSIWDLISVSSVSSIDLTFSRSGPTIETGSSGKFYRPEDDVLLVQNIDWRAKRYLFTGTGGGSYTSENEYSTSEPTETCGCTGCNPGVNSFLNIGAGPLVSYSLSGTTFSLRYLAVSRYDVTGISLTPTATGVAQGMWTIKSTGGQIVLESQSGLTFAYGGTLTAVASQIQSAGYFTATVGSKVVSGAKTSDLPEFLVRTYSSTACLPILLAGTHLAPSSTGAGFTSGLSSSTFQRGMGYADNQSGLNSYLTTGFNNPTLLAVQLGYGSQIFYPGPFLFYLPMHFENTGGGTSTVTSSLDCTIYGSELTETGAVSCIENTPPEIDANGIPYCPDGNIPSPCCGPPCPDPGPGCFDAAGGGEGCVICTPGGGGGEPACDPALGGGCPETCCYKKCQTLVYTAEARSISWSQSVSGSFSLG